MRQQNMSGRRSLILGLTGGIASGKSLVAEAFRTLGALVVSADDLAREAVRPGSEPLRQLVDRFGRKILLADGALDRKALAEQIFADDRAREALNRITHPAIAALAEKRLRELAQRGAPLVVYEAPLLFETGAEKRVDAVLVVSIDERQQRTRLMQRDGLNEEQVQARIASQMPQAEKAAKADYVLENSGSPEATVEQVRRLFQKLVAPAAPDLSENQE